MNVQQRSVWIAGAMLLVGSGCGLEEVDDAGEQDDIPAPVQAAFDESCATSSACHAAGSSLVILAAPESSAILTASSASGGGPFVTLGNLDESYIAQKILAGSSAIGDQMPPAPQSDNDDLNTAIIIGWIAGVEVDDDVSGDGDGDGDGDPNSCPLPDPEVPIEATFANVWPILEASCSCHAGFAPAMPDEATAYANLVTAMPDEFVVPGDPDASYMWHKLMGTQLEFNGDTGSSMPQGGQLCASEYQLIYAWILAGAPE